MFVVGLGVGGVKHSNVVSDFEEPPTKCLDTPHSRHSRLRGARAQQSTRFRIRVYWAPLIQCSAHFFVEKLKWSLKEQETPFQTKIHSQNLQNLAETQKRQL